MVVVMVVVAVVVIMTVVRAVELFGWVGDTRGSDAVMVVLVLVTVIRMVIHVIVTLVRVVASLSKPSIRRINP